MSRALVVLAALSLLPATFAACGGNDAASSSTPRKPGQIGMKDLKFAPADATVKAGQKVTWTNEESVPHNVVSDDGQLKSSTFGKDGTYSFTPKKAGDISYVCTLHPGMKGTLKVTK
jgi:plastocyanin